MAEHRAELRGIGTELRARREQAGLTTCELAELLRRNGVHLTERTLLAYEYADRDLSVKRLLQLCAALGVSPTGVLGCGLERADRQPCPTCGEVPA